MRVKPPLQYMTWKVLVVDEADPYAFGQKLQEALQELSNEGFAVVSQMPRGSAYVIVGRQMLPGDPTGDTMPPPPPAREPGRSPPPFGGAGQHQAEAVYYYKQEGEQRHKAFAALGGAVRLLRAHLEDPGVLPLKIVFVRMTAFEPSTFSFLLRTFIEESEPEPAS